MKRRTFIAFILILGAWLAIACGSQNGAVLPDQSAPSDWMQGYQVPDQPERLDALRAAHRELINEENEGAPCERDDACSAPMRCVDKRCAWPPAMSGYADAYTPVAVIDTERGAKRFFVELAQNDQERARGLMLRRSMQPEFGMLFVFDREKQQSFWMRNTLMPLDMIFIRADGAIDSIIENAEPLSETPRPSEGPARYVLELEGGAAAFHGITPGQRVRFFNVD